MSSQLRQTSSAAVSQLSQEIQSRSSPLVSVGLLVWEAPSQWCRAAWTSNALRFAGLCFSSTLHAGKWAKWKYQLSHVINIPTVGGQWLVSVFAIIAENSRWNQWRTLFMISEQLLYTQPHLCLSPALRKSLLLHRTSNVQERACFGTDSTFLTWASLN